MKNASTVLLSVEENIDENQLDQINRALKTHKDFGGYRMLDWVSYHSVHSRVLDDDDDDEGRDPSFEVAENYMRTPRGAVNRRKISSGKSQEQPEEDLSVSDREKIESTILGIEAHMNLWLNQERSKQNMYLRKKNL